MKIFQGSNNLRYGSDCHGIIRNKTVLSTNIMGTKEINSGLYLLESFL